MFEPINRIAYLSLGRVDDGVGETFERSLLKDWSLAVAVFGRNSEFLVLESHLDEEKIFEKKFFEEVIDDFFWEHPYGEVNTLKIRSLLIGAYKNLSDSEFCSGNTNYFCTDYDASISEFYPSLFVTCKSIDTFEGAFFSSDYGEIKYDAEKFFSLFSLRDRLSLGTNHVYGVMV
ncbi:hypothetical protein [Polynucleobacter sp. AP-Sving-400A-A2]|uniref:hypothetical protein n=1 Tax=Polynucleobacter sp. AP-Sving-400A-A2 TaxID=2081049 RepID=UPI001BFD1C2D|nr:hypothetical protein [Polynucleobacter sp. AP-Sving-400A-A2]QWE13967.1 hypothetical protein C2758_07240 [Polynucleobacter sp. AP-Sving-400A-A2]